MKHRLASTSACQRRAQRAGNVKNINRCLHTNPNNFVIEISGFVLDDRVHLGDPPFPAVLIRMTSIRTIDGNRAATPKLPCLEPAYSSWGIWNDSWVCGIVTPASCHVIAMRANDGEEMVSRRMVSNQMELGNAIWLRMGRMDADRLACPASGTLRSPSKVLVEDEEGWRGISRW